ncbi:hypothetical protein HispidOSU_006769 [Sigmodon hispidus]
MMFPKVLVISALCALAVAFPSLDTEATYYTLDPSSEELLNSTADSEELQDSTTDLLTPTQNLPTPVEEVVIAFVEDDTNNNPTNEFNSDLMSTTEVYHESTQNFVSSPDDEGAMTSYLEENSEA